MSNLLARLAFGLLLLHQEDCTTAIRGQAKTDPVSESDNIKLDLATISTDSSVLKFTVTNIGDTDLAISPLASNENRIIVITPANQQIEWYVLSDLGKRVVIESGNSVAWTYDVIEDLETVNAESGEYQLGDGTYRIWWVIGEHKSNEVLVEKKGPAV